ncbi:MAG: hypothetical protein GX444_00935 [Myxococcales bacterium]|nr:hypothetical protein [Myxococcales bacterium]
MSRTDATPDRYFPNGNADGLIHSRFGRLPVFVSLLLVLACTPSLRDRQNEILSACQIEVRLGGSVRAILRAHPNHQAAGNGIYWYTQSGPEQVNRLVRLRGENDTILWLQIQDEPVAANLESEQTRFEAETDRLEAILGAPRREGTRLTPVRRAFWTLADGQLVEWKLEIAAEQQAARRTLTFGRPLGAPPQ